jgi:hypothetical protein
MRPGELQRSSDSADTEAAGRHRHCNHTLANLNADDFKCAQSVCANGTLLIAPFSPFGLHEAPPEDRGTLPEYTRDQALDWSQRMIREAKERHQQQTISGQDTQKPTA